MTATTWNFDLSHSSVNFFVRHLMVSKVHGRFQTWGGTLTIDDADIANSRVEVSIDTASIDTKEEKRDAHLRSADFFDVENHPKLTFVSTSVKKVSDDELEVVGDLTIRGTTKPVTLKVESNGTVKDPWGGTRAGFSAKASISRKDFGLHWNALLETGGVVVGDKIEIGLEIEAIQAAASKAA
jgi:polyisoprenoid-binding protein YceI